MIFSGSRTFWNYQDMCAAVVAASLLLVMVGGCEKKSVNNEKKSAKFAINKLYRRGPCSFTLKVDKQEITIAQHLKLVIEARAKEGLKVELPRFGDKLDQFKISDFQEPAPRMIADKTLLYSRTYILNPFLSGTYKIAPMTVTFAQPGEKKKHEIKSEEIQVEVRSLLPADAAKLKIRDIAGPVNMPQPDNTWVILGVVAGLLVLGLAGGLIMTRKRERVQEQEKVQMSAHAIACQELAALIAEDLPSKGMIKEFYQRLSGILRHYIERRFSLRAPELTTEEFLDQLRNANSLGTEHKCLLGEFMRHCDLVKFAALAPDTSQIQQTFDACKRFIAETTEASGGDEG